MGHRRIAYRTQLYRKVFRLARHGLIFTASVYVEILGVAIHRIKSQRTRTIAVAGGNGPLDACPVQQRTARRDDLQQEIEVGDVGRQDCETEILRLKEERAVMDGPAPCVAVVAMRPGKDARQGPAVKPARRKPARGNDARESCRKNPCFTRFRWSRPAARCAWRRRFTRPPAIPSWRLASAV